MNYYWCWKQPKAQNSVVNMMGNADSSQLMWQATVMFIINRDMIFLGTRSTSNRSDTGHELEGADLNVVGTIPNMYKNDKRVRAKLQIQ